MEKSIKQIEKDLENAKKVKKDKEIAKELSNMNLVGKCYSTHHLNRHMTSKPSYHFEVIYIIDKNYNKAHYSKYYYIVDILNVFKNGSSFKISRNIENIGRSSLSFNNEITLEQFNHVVNTVIPDCEASVGKLRFAFKHRDYVSSGDYGDERNKGELLDDQGIKCIDLETLPEKIKEKGYSNIGILEILRWQRHPYLYNSKLYKSLNWLELIIKIRDDLRNHAYSWGDSILDRDLPRIALLDKFISYCKII